MLSGATTLADAAPPPALPRRPGATRKCTANHAINPADTIPAKMNHGLVHQTATGRLSSSIFFSISAHDSSTGGTGMGLSSAEKKAWSGILSLLSIRFQEKYLSMTTFIFFRLSLKCHFTVPDDIFN